MLKYVDSKIVFSEVPDEISLALSISGCPNNCEECHSSYLTQDIGTSLTYNEIHKLIQDNKGITCICLMGGDGNYHQINIIAYYIKKNYDLKVAWYSGNQSLSPEISLKNFDYIKLGPYKKDLGPLNSKSTNQRFYKIVYAENKHTPELKDITYKFWNMK